MLKTLNIMDNKNKYVGISIIGLLAMFAVALAIPANVGNTGVGDSGKWTGTVCAELNGEPLGCTHNLLVDQGQNFSAEVISGEDFTGAAAGTDYAKHISLSTATTTSSTDTVIDSEVTGNGLDRATGTCAINGVGNFSCWKTFTATGTQAGIDAAGLNWNVTSQANSLVAANNLSSTVNLESSDLLLIGSILSNTLNSDHTCPL